MSFPNASEEASIRQLVIVSLDEQFDRYLAQAHLLQILFIIFNDEVFSIREATMGILGRLSHRNPAYVLPTLRKILIQLMTEIQCAIARSALLT